MLVTFFPLLFVPPPDPVKASDLKRFPSSYVVKTELHRYCAFRDQLDRMVPIGLTLREIELLRDQCSMALKVWDALDDAHNATAVNSDPVYALSRVKDLIGGEAYRSGQFLPWLPDCWLRY